MQFFVVVFLTSDQNYKDFTKLRKQQQIKFFMRTRIYSKTKARTHHIYSKMSAKMKMAQLNLQSILFNTQ